MKKRDDLLGVETLRRTGREPKKQSPSSLRILPWLAALTVVAAIAFAFGKYSKQPDGSVAKRSPNQVLVSDVKTPLIDPDVAKVVKPAPVITRAKMVGIWAPLENGCGGGYGVAYTANGRFSDGDEYFGEEGKWSLNDDILVRKSSLEYKSIESEDGTDTDERKVSASNDVLKLTVTWLDSDELTIMSEGKKFRYVKCSDGRHIFEDGEVFES